MSPERPLPKTNTAETLLGEVRMLVARVGLPEAVDAQRVPAFLLPSALQTLADWQIFEAGRLRETLVDSEWPMIIQAHRMTQLGQTRELIALDKSWAVATARLPAALTAAREAGAGIGRRQVERLRPLRDQRLVQRYLAAIESGEARGWHPLVYGVVLAVFALPLRQGLAAYARQMAAGFLAATPLAGEWTAAQQTELLDAVEIRWQPALNQLLPGFSPG